MFLRRVIAHRGQSVPELVQFWQIATQYQLLHTAALVATAALPDRSALPAAAGFLAGAQQLPAAEGCWLAQVLGACSQRSLVGAQQLTAGSCWWT